MSEIHVAAVTLRCSQCGRQYSPEDVLIYGARAVCGTCKPTFFQRLLEGASMSGQLAFAGFWIRVLARCVDAIPLLVVNQALTGITGAMSPGNPRTAVVWTAMSASFVGISVLTDMLYNAFFVARLGGTPGKLALGLKVVTADGGKLTLGRSFGRAAAYYINPFTLNIGCLMAAFDDEKRALHDRICETRVIQT